MSEAFQSSLSAESKKACASTWQAPAAKNGLSGRSKLLFKSAFCSAVLKIIDDAVLSGLTGNVHINVYALMGPWRRRV